MSLGLFISFSHFLSSGDMLFAILAISHFVKFHPGSPRFSRRLDKVFAKVAFSIGITPFSKNAEGEKSRITH